jgi:small-conductance mechanosensitive channel
VRFLSQVPGGADEVVNDVVDELTRLTIIDWLVAVGVVVVAAVVARYVGKWAFNVLGGESSLGAVTISRFVRAGILAVGFAIGLFIVGVDLTPVVIFLAAALFLAAVSFGPAMADYVAGVVLTAKRPFDLGDLVTISGHRGIVVDHDLRAVTLRHVDREDITIPNRVAIAEVIVNATADGTLRTKVPVSVAYGSDLDLARQIVLEAVTGVSGVEAGPEVRYTALGESSVDMNVIVFHHPSVDLKERITDEIVTRSHDALAAAGITIPFPQRDVWLRGGEDA